MTGLRGVTRRSVDEVRWLINAVVGVLRTAPALVLLWAGGGLIVTALTGSYVAAWPVLVWCLVPSALALWARAHAGSFEAALAGPWRRRRVCRWVTASWDEVRQGAGLPEGASLDERPRWVGSELVMRPRLPMGVTLDDFEQVTDRLEAGLRAFRIRAASPCPGVVELRGLFFDPLIAPFLAEVPNDDAPAAWESVPIGRCEDGRVWSWQVRVSTLTAGASGSGKGSLLWSLVIGLGPAIKAGLVRVYGIDLKGGMELGMGRDLFHRVATSSEDSIAILTEVAVLLGSRASSLAGVTRQHTPTRESPHVVVVIDELAALVAYGERKDRERGEAALNVLLSQGRAVGVVVAAFVQDPRKEVVRSRGLFPASLGLRLRGREEVAMVLGDGARAAGATCDRIPLSMPGTGYVLGDGESYPVRVRAGYVTDDAIRLAASRFGMRTPPAEVEPALGSNGAHEERMDAVIADESPPCRRGGAGTTSLRAKKRAPSC